MPGCWPTAAAPQWVLLLLLLLLLLVCRCCPLLARGPCSIQPLLLLLLLLPSFHNDSSICLGAHLLPLLLHLLQQLQQ